MMPLITAYTVPHHSMAWVASIRAIIDSRSGTSLFSISARQSVSGSRWFRSR